MNSTSGQADGAQQDCWVSELTVLEFICAAYEQLRSDMASVKLAMNTTSGHVHGAQDNRVGLKITHDSCTT